MECTIVGAESKTRSHPIRSFVAVSGEPQQAELLNVLSADDHDYGVIFVDSIGRSYSRIKQLIPDIVIVYCAIDDVAACQLLSMLKLDAELSYVRVVTCAAAPAKSGLPSSFSDTVEPSTDIAVPLQMN
jgi:hypothetical protein